MSGVVRGRFDVERLAEQLMTDTAGYLAQRQSQSVSEDYQASQKASRGGKALSPWESELINDAQFTANTPLPSVTFDVNDEMLAHRIGEDVSHFYHPTPPPPRNPSGFWQRYENVFERRALIAEGRAAANSEVMHERLGNTAANQQSYLDLGYTESVTQTRAGWIGISEIPAPQLIRTGIQTTRFLAENKWGFFGRNEVKGSLTTESANHINGLRLQRSLIIEQAKSIFTETGKLRSEIISKSDIIIPGEDLNNQKLIQELILRGGDISDWGKYETRSILSPSGNFRVHFYRNSVTGEVYYGMDYKAVFDHQGVWDIKLQPNFDYEPPKFNP